MWEFHLIHVRTNEEKVIFGYTLSDAYRRNSLLNPEDWACVMHVYID